MTKKRKNPLHVAIIWNMHQPFYKDMATSTYMLPWVRMHGIKDYYGMVHILRDFPQIHQTFNLVPSLLKQIQDYNQQGLEHIEEKLLRITLKPVSELSEDDKIFLLSEGFLSNWQEMVYPYPRFNQLLHKRGVLVSNNELERIQAYFSQQEYLDLQIWTNLTWIDPFFRNDPQIQKLFEKGINFSEEDKLILLKVQSQIMSSIIPEYQALAQRGQIELITSPMYHPILPLLCDSHYALPAVTDLKIPSTRFIHPEDAVAQLQRGVATFSEIMGIKPQGMWPSEGSVCEEIIPMIAEAGIKWIATDEQILAKSLDVLLERDANNGLKEPTLLYQPYIIENKGKKLSIVFRDHLLSDLIGFEYSRMDAQTAADDFINRLININNSLPPDENYLVSIILDGENAWEYYPNNGQDFFYALYKKLSHEPLLKTVTVSEFLNENPPQKTLDRLFPGSWINHNFKIWIGHEEDNSAWDQISLTREALVKYQQTHPDADPKLLENAWEEIYIAEGSDWFWWYGEEHNSANDEMFDNLFRQQLMNVYNMLYLEVPETLTFTNLIKDKRCRPKIEAKGFVNPIIDGKITDYYEWLAAGSFDVMSNCGSINQAMHQNIRILNGLHYGFNLENLFLCVDFFPLWHDEVFNCSFYLNFLKPVEFSLEIKALDEKFKATLYNQIDSENRQIVECDVRVAFKKVMEIQIPLAAIGAKSGDEIDMTFSIEKNNLELLHWPAKGYMLLTVPGTNFECELWQV